MEVQHAIGLNGAVVWVTGARGGIGAAIARAFVSEGAKVIATDLIIDEESEYRTMRCDVRSTIEIAEVASWCDALGGVDVLINNAGIMRRSDPLDVSPDVWDEVMNVNVKGTLLCSQAAAKSMVGHGRGGVIINIGSVNAEKVFADTVAYSTSKGAIHGMTRAMALALAPSGIRVNTLAPGAVCDTNLESARWQSDQEKILMSSRTPLGRLGQSNDIAPAAVFLASARASFITGTTLYVDGGRTASV